MRRFQNEQRSPALAALANARYERLRKEKLQIDFDHSGKKLRYAVQAEHESIVRITGRINLSAFANLSCSQNVETEILNFIASIGTSLQVYF